MDLEDILLGTALSIPDITNDLLAVPDSRVNVPHPRPAVKLGSDSGLQYDADSKDDCDPLEVLCDTAPWVRRRTTSFAMPLLYRATVACSVADHDGPK